MLYLCRNYVPFSMQELFCCGTELSLQALTEAKKSIDSATPAVESADSAHQQQFHHRSCSLMSLASRGGGRIPVDAVVSFIRLARSYNQKEVVDILADPTVKIAKVCMFGMYARLCLLKCSSISIENFS